MAIVSSLLSGCWLG